MAGAQKVHARILNFRKQTNNVEEDTVTNTVSAGNLTLEALPPPSPSLLPSPPLPSPSPPSPPLLPKNIIIYNNLVKSNKDHQKVAKKKQDFKS